MKINIEHGNYSLSAMWLVKLRWIAISAIVLFLFIAYTILKIPAPLFPISIVLFILIAINICMTIYVRQQKKMYGNHFSFNRKIIYVQILTDIFLLSVILHYSGGIENPFIAIYLLHIVIAAIFLPLRESIIITIFTNFLLGCMVILEYLHIIKHYELTGFLSNDIHLNTTFIFLTGFVFTILSFAIVYLTNMITKQLRENQILLEDLKEDLINHNQKSNIYVLTLLQKIQNHYDNCSMDIKESNVDRMAFVNLLENLKTLIELRLKNRIITEKFKLVDLIKSVFNEFSKNKLKPSVYSSINGSFIASIENHISKNNNNNKVKKSVPLSFSIDKNLDAVVGNQDLLKIMLSQIIHNAVKFNPENGQVYFKTKAMNNKLRIEIYDSGSGINKKDQDKIFEEFYTFNNPINFKNKTNGLGLSLVKEITEIHDGKIWIDSKKGKGTKFNIELPILVKE